MSHATHNLSQKALLDVVGSDRDSLDDELHTPKRSKLCGEHSSVAAFSPVFGSILYVAGSILFFPVYDMMDWGCILYIVGIVFYLLGGLPHLLTLGSRHPDRSLLYVGVAAEVGLYAAKILYTIGCPSVCWSLLVTCSCSISLRSLQPYLFSCFCT